MQQLLRDILVCFNRIMKISYLYAETKLIGFLLDSFQRLKCINLPIIKYAADRAY